MIPPTWNLSKNTGRNKKSSFLLWQICQFNHYGWLILLKLYWFLNSTSKNLLLAHFLIRPILNPKFPLMLYLYALWRVRVEDKVVTTEVVNCITTQTTWISKYVFFSHFQEACTSSRDNSHVCRSCTWVSM